ncbi:MAG TPA: glycosyltransferase family 2 protein [Candidatus Margulisiibacteriota bacterium]|nr:glycosyltransferase family 2 protein [Candidatus Margulisiibacteriota bacterium]
MRPSVLTNMQQPARSISEQPAPAIGRRATLSVVVPALDEGAAIADILTRLLALRPLLAQHGIVGPEVIVVDDGSRDRTSEVARQIDGVQVIRHGTTRGYGAALKSGLARAHGELLAFLDADGTYPPESFLPLCEAALNGADLVIGSRMAPASGAPNGMPATRRLGNRLFAALVTLLGDRRVHDCASGMRVIRRSVLARLYPLPDGLNFTPIMSLRAVHEGLVLEEVPIAYADRIGESKLRIGRDGLRYLQSILWIALSYNPVRVLGGLGAAGVGAAALIGVGLVLARVGGVTTLGPWGVAAIFVALVAAVAGVSVFALGAMFNYLLTLFRGQTVRVGLLGKPLFATPLEHHFGWLGLSVAVAGLTIACVALALGLHGWDVARLWLYLVGSALFILVGLQLVIAWAVMRTLDDLSQREIRARSDTLGGPALE